LGSHADIPIINAGILTQPEIHFVLNGNFHSSEIAGTLTGDYVAHLSGNSIVINSHGVLLGAAREITISPENDSCSFILNDVTIGVQFHWQRKEDQRFVGGLKLVCSGDVIAAINVVNIEEYLTSVISSEMSADCSLNLLKAHAITSRSWLIAQVEKSRALKAGRTTYQTFFETETERIRWYDREDHELFDVCADDHCQRYQGITKVYTAPVNQAVQETSGTVVVYDGNVCDARFSKSCGGVMEVFENVWEPVHHPYLAAVVDTPTQTTDVSLDFSKEENAEKWIRCSPPAFCNTTDKKTLSQVLLKYDQETTDFYRWKVEYEQNELAEIIGRRSGIDFGQIADLIPVERGKSARLTKLRIAGTKRTFTIGKELEIRRTLSNSHLYSSAIVFDKVDVKEGIPQKFILYGAGWGHGVGLCQIGAAVMGEQGYSYDKILSHYFPQTEIKKLY
jgi:SpoIID/LytB domain protein